MKEDPIKPSDGEKKYKNIKLGDVTVVTSDERLARMYQGLPGLQFIFGSQHPNPKYGYDFGLFGYGTQTSDWVLLANFFSPTCILPTTADKWDRLVYVATILGGSDAVEGAYKSMLQNRIVLPVDDVQDLFSWFTVRTGDMQNEEKEKLDENIKDGFKLVYEEPYTVDSSGMTYFLRHYRKRNT